MAKEEYAVVLTVQGKKYKATGKTVLDALEKLTPKNTKGYSIVSVTHGKRVKERVIGSIQTTKMFSGSPTVRKIVLKQVALTFDL
jgi:hypothetical protein